MMQLCIAIELEVLFAEWLQATAFMHDETSGSRHMRRAWLTVYFRRDDFQEVRV